MISIEKKRAYDRARYLANSGPAKERARKRREDDPECALEEIERWRRENPIAYRESSRATVRKWRKNNPLMVRAEKQRAQARKRDAPGPRHTAQEWEAKKRDFDGRCAYCFGLCRQTIDHVVPLERGGSDAIANCVPACRSCNSSKGTKKLLEWLDV